MKLDYRELEDLIFDINLLMRSKIEKHNRAGTLKDYLKSIQLYDEIYGYEEELTSYPYGKILVIGDSKVKKNQLVGILKKLGLEEDRFEFILGYDEAGKYDFRKLKYSEYRVILAGPMPHSTIGKGEYGSIIEKMKRDRGYPRVEEIFVNSKLKITKTSFRKALEELLEEGYIV